MTRLVAVSNRVDAPKRATPAGGLAVGVLAAMKARGGLWFGWSGETSDGPPGPATVTSRHDVAFATIDLPRADFEPYYAGYCNGALWPLFHYFVDAVQYSETQHAAYARVNGLFAARLRPLLRDDDLVWVHDYHLIPLGRELRALGVSRPLGFFLHIPFPHVEALRALPGFEQLLRDLLAYDLVGFQTRRDLACFRAAVAEILGDDAVRSEGVILHRVGRTRVDVFPIGVDVDAMQRLAAQSQSSETVKRMSSGLLSRRCVIGVDRLDYSKGLVDRFLAYERFMEAHPESLNRITFLQIAPLSRTDVRTYGEIRRSLEQAAGRINGRFAETDWTPIRYLNRNFSHEVLSGFLRNACVGVVTPVRDGMNLVAKEYVAAQDPADPGVLVLSTLAGAAEELRSALLVNPRDMRGVADAIHRALEMPRAERRVRHERLLDVLRRNDIHAWHGRFIEQLVAVDRASGPPRTAPPSTIVRSSAVR
ncbi:MAG: trehalose-6-phosphate synthase [Steroidobacteraceae bacterium]|nr:trehalose-6-phosphate synthase [Steroidobacteraceae bacterium]